MFKPYMERWGALQNSTQPKYFHLKKPLSLFIYSHMWKIWSHINFRSRRDVRFYWILLTLYKSSANRTTQPHWNTLFKITFYIQSHIIVKKFVSYEQATQLVSSYVKTEKAIPKSNFFTPRQQFRAYVWRRCNFI